MDGVKALIDGFEKMRETLGALTTEVRVLTDHVVRQNARLTTLEAIAQQNCINIAVLQTQQLEHMGTGNRNVDRVWQIVMPLLSGVFGAGLVLIVSALRAGP